MSNVRNIEATSRPYPARSSLAGQQVDQFRILRLLGRGGMGEVYLARDTHLGRKVALKFMRNVSDTSQFVTEARATAQFNHPNVVTLFSVGTYQDAPYFALEYLPGQTLRDRIKTDLPSYREALELALALSSALSEAHARQIVHCDLKPENIVIPADGRLRVLDFGLAQSTRAGAFVSAGSPAYMPPEQWERGLVGTQTDIWALGVILYEMLDGRRPFRRYEVDLQTLGQAIRLGAPIPTLEVPNEAMSFVTHCLERRASDRPTAKEAESKLRSLIERHQNRVAPRDARQKTEAPFRGLLAFGPMQAFFFFGRDTETAALIERVRQASFVPVVGPSGVGKSSLVRASLIPRMSGFGSGRVLQMRPGPRPFRSLQACLEEEQSASSVDWDKIQTHPEQLGLQLLTYMKASSTPLLLFVDQLEEIFTLPGDPEVASSFLRALMSAADDLKDQLRIVCTLRDDYLLRAAETHPEVSEGFRKPFFVRVPSRAALVETLVGPVQMTGHRFEDGLVDVMVDAVGSDRAGLPLLQFAALKLWEARDVERLLLTRSAYDAMGGVAGALVQHGDRVLDGLDVQDVPIARELLLRLVTDERTRRVASSPEVLEGLGSRAERVLDALISARLITTTELAGAAALELAHESLIRDWGRLRSWVDAQQEDFRFLSEARKVAEVWDRRGRRIEEVWTRRSLAEAEVMLEAYAGPVPALVADFIEAGRQAERRRVLRWRGAALAMVSFWIIVFSVFIVQRQDALSAQRKAEDYRRLATKAEVEAKADVNRVQRSAAGARNAARFVLAVGHRSSDPTLSVAFLREMEPEGPQPSGVRAFAEDVLEDGITEVVFSHKDSVMSASFSPDGMRVVTASADSIAQIWNADGSGRPIVLRGHEGTIYAASFSPDGHFVATASVDKTIRLWGADGSGTPLVFRGHGGPVYSVSFSLDGRRLVTGSADTTVRVWRIDGSEAPVILRGHEASILGVSFSPDGRRIVSGSNDQTVRVWSIESATAPFILRGHQASVYTASFSPNGQRIVTASEDGTVRLWSGDGFEVQHILRFEERVSGASFSPDGSRIAVALMNGNAEIHGADGSVRPVVLRGHEGKVRRVSFRPDGARIVTASFDGTARIWDFSGIALSKREGLWGVTCYCPSSEVRMRLLNLSFGEAWRQYQRCQTRVFSSLGCESVSLSTSDRGRSALDVDSARVPRPRAPLSLETRAATRYRPKLIRIPAGSFWMGSPEDEPGRGTDELRHRVTLTQGYWLADSEVTQGQWLALMGSAPSYFDVDRGGGLDHPVERVSWYDAISYCNRLSVREGRSVCYRVEGCWGSVGMGCKEGIHLCHASQGCGVVRRIPNCTGYRLPTEAEWERAVRAGSDTALPSGPIQILALNHALAVGQVGWYSGNSGLRWGGGYDCSGLRDREQFSVLCGSHPVKSKDRNVFGLYDMIGNVWEWVEDVYEPYLSKPIQDPDFAEWTANQHVVNKGCGWLNYARYCRSAARLNDHPAFRYSDLGFRPARSTLDP